jgi:hypothetical protein
METLIREKPFAPVVDRAVRTAICFPLLLAFVTSGCSSDAEDREFFNSGWLRPEKGAEARMGESARVSKNRGGALTPHAAPEYREPAF